MYISAYTYKPKEIASITKRMTTTRASILKGGVRIHNLKDTVTNLKSGLFIIICRIIFCLKLHFIRHNMVYVYVYVHILSDNLTKHVMLLNIQVRIFPTVPLNDTFEKRMTFCVRLK